MSSATESQAAQDYESPFESPDFSKKQFQKICLNTAKQAKMNSNDFTCSSNIEKLFAECERLSEIAKRKTAIIAQRKKEYEKFQNEKRKFEQDAAQFNGAIADQQALKDKDAEIEYLTSQLRKKEDENTKLKAEIEQILRDQMTTLDKMQKKTD